MTQRKLSIVLFTVLAIQLAGCGQKGGLFLPEPPGSPEAAEPEDPQAEEEEKEHSTGKSL